MQVMACSMYATVSCIAGALGWLRYVTLTNDCLHVFLLMLLMADEKDSPLFTVSIGTRAGSSLWAVDSDVTAFANAMSVVIYPLFLR